jgi:hypothetical protein
MEYEEEPRKFYVILLSNASQKLYPTNTLSSFKAHLARSVDLGSAGIGKLGYAK